MNFLLSLSANRLKLIVIALPLLLLSAYLAFVAADRYVSTATIAVQRTGGDTSSIPGAALLLAGVTAPSTQDTHYLIQYIRSLAMLQKLDKALNLREHYSTRGGIDLAYRLSATASQEDFLDYFRRRVDVSFEDTSGLLTVQVQAFEPAFAQRVSQFILDESERFVNESSHVIARGQLGFAEGEMKTASERLVKARDQLLAFQNKNRMLDPAAQAQTSLGITAELEIVLARRESELKNLLTFLNDSAPQVMSARGEINALKAQIDAERNRATVKGRDGERMNNLAAEFQSLRLQVDFATDAYKLALGAVENSRIDATRKLKTLTVIEPSSLAQTAQYPLRIYALASLGLACLLLYAIVRLVLATIREHHD